MKVKSAWLPPNETRYVEFSHSGSKLSSFEFEAWLEVNGNVLRCYCYQDEKVQYEEFYFQVIEK